MNYELQPLNDSRKSFYGKANVKTENGRKTLISYTTEVAYIENGQATVLGTYSSTTLRHIKEFLLQEGFQIGTKAEIIKMYGKDDEK